MKNLKFIFLSMLIILACFGGTIKDCHAQDVFGRARSTDTLYLNPNDFQIGDVIAVDTVAGQKVFVPAASNLKFVGKITDAGEGFAIQTILNKTGSTFTPSAGDPGQYELYFSAAIFSGKTVYVPPIIVATGDFGGGPVTITGYMIQNPEGGALTNILSLRSFQTSDGALAHDIATNQLIFIYIF